MKLFGAIVNYEITGYDYPDIPIYGREIIGISKSAEGCRKLIEKYKDEKNKFRCLYEQYENTDDTLIIGDNKYVFTIKEVELDTLFKEELF